MASLRELVESLNRPAPELPDVEDPTNVEEIWTRKEQLQTEDNKVVEQLPTRGFRKTLLDDDDIGEKVSAKDVFSEEGISGLSLGAESSTYENETDEDQHTALSEEEESEKELVSDQENDEESHASGGGKDETDDDREEGLDHIEVKEVLPSLDLEHQIYKGKCIQRQLNIFDKLMRLQIKTHVALRAYNRLPRGKLAKQLLKEADEETIENHKQMRKKMFEFLETLLLIEDALLASSKQTVSIVKAKDDTNDIEDEEIESSEDEEDKETLQVKGDEETDDGGMANVIHSDDQSESKKEVEGFRKKAQNKYRILNQLDCQLKQREARFIKFRNQTLSKWDERTHLMSVTKVGKKNFSGFDSLVLKQIEQIMADKQRLIRRTQTKRSDVDRIGGNPEVTHDAEIFDDDDFYQGILRDLIERKSVDSTDPIEMSRQWIELQQLRQKRSKKKKVDTKASKGRKIRYVVMPKLVNYYPSMPETVKWSHEMRNHLFESLFSSTAS